VPPPPQAEGKNKFWAAKVDSKVEPALVVIFFDSSSLTMMEHFLAALT